MQSDRKHVFYLDTNQGHYTASKCETWKYCTERPGDSMNSIVHTVQAPIASRDLKKIIELGHTLPIKILPGHFYKVRLVVW